MKGKKPISRAEVIRLARELGQALSCSQDLYNYREAERMMASDSEARYLMLTFKSKQAQLEALKASVNSDESQIEKILQELKEADKKMKVHPLIAAYYEKGQDLNELIYQINMILRHFTMEEDEFSVNLTNKKCTGCSNCNK
ncbi:MAG: YlbF family regulator [Clostridiales bacterium]|nr:YlbF family regulator [Clostridiales bacterium]